MVLRLGEQTTDARRFQKNARANAAAYAVDAAQVTSATQQQNAPEQQLLQACFTHPIANFLGTRTHARYERNGGHKPRRGRDIAGRRR
jgi:hypothetical protein